MQLQRIIFQIPPDLLKKMQGKMKEHSIISRSEAIRRAIEDWVKTNNQKKAS